MAWSFARRTAASRTGSASLMASARPYRKEGERCQGNRRSAWMEAAFSEGAVILVRCVASRKNTKKVCPFSSLRTLQIEGGTSRPDGTRCAGSIPSIVTGPPFDKEIRS